MCMYLGSDSLSEMHDEEFNLFDTNGDDVIDPQELREYFFIFT